MKRWPLMTALVTAILAMPMVSSPIQADPRAEITVATYNVCKVNCSGTHPWAQRRDAVVNNAAAADPAVLAVQEAPTLPFRGTTQWADLTRLLAGAGFKQTSDQDGCSEGCTRGAHLYYDPDRVRVFRSGSRSTGMHSLRGLSNVDFGPIQDRNVTWAYLQDIATGGVFMAVSVHLPNEKTAKGEQVRRAAALGVSKWIDAQNAERAMTGVPVVLMGDLNSFAARQPRGAQWIFEQAGFIDSFQAARRINARYPTANYTPLTRQWDGFPPEPQKYARAASRIDYILGRNGVMPLRYEVFLTLRNGRFDNRFRGSDHNLVLASLALPVVQP